MPPSLDAAFAKARNLWVKTNMTQRIFIVGMTVVVVGAFLAMILWLNRPDYKVLYSKLQSEDVIRITGMLDASKEKYKLENEGTTILVPEERVYDLRLKVAEEGAIVGSGVGFEIFDEVKVGQTEFVQKINFQRALQGELGRTISEFPAIEKARIHLVLPKKSLFIEEQQQPSASVVLKLVEGKKLDAKEVQAIINLVSMSVEGLDRDRISIADTRGKLLFSPKDDTSLEGLTTTQLEYKVTLQQNLERRIEEMLFPVIGPGRVIAKVNADLDFSHKTIHKEMYDPEGQVVRSEQRSEESTRGQANLEAGSPEPNFRGDGLTGGLSQQQGSRESRTTNYEITKEEQEIVASLGDIKRLSVAVIVDGTYEASEEPGGDYIFTPRKEAEMERIRQLVQNIVGYDRARGDGLEITSISFGGPEIEVEPSLAAVLMEYAMRLGKPLLNALLIFLFLVLVVRPVILSLIRPRVEGEMVEGLEGLPETEERLALIEGEDGEEDALEALKKIEDVKAHALQLSEQNMDQALAIVRGWMKQQEGSRVG
jgi:flagellar M-ring protein FliF